ncbi:conserved domain protein [Roseibium sp. TrichSKD4]|nr:conserved domain protein [Roseibium sp. TrichSKD4]
MYASFQQLTHRKIRQCHALTPAFSGFTSARGM